jgi:hypothetical protein
VGEMALPGVARILHAHDLFCEFHSTVLSRTVKQIVNEMNSVILRSVTRVSQSADVISHAIRRVTPSSRHSQLKMDPAPRLACEQCKKRKIRCSKGSPCSACKNADLQCHTVQRARLPRGKSGKARTHNAMLESRVVRIEDLLARRDEVLDTSCLSAEKSNDCYERTTSGYNSRGKAKSFVAPDFWTELAEEVHGLRETLENSEDENRDQDQKNQLAHDRSNGAGAILFQHTNQRTTAEIEPPSSETGRILLETYRQRVDSVYKVLHWPTVLSLVELHHKRPLDSSRVHSVQVLEWSIYFMAVCSITEKESKEMGLGGRSAVLRTYRSLVEDLLAKSSLLQSPDLVLLQAFVIYLVCHILFSHLCFLG